MLIFNILDLFHNFMMQKYNAIINIISLRESYLTLKI